VNIDELGNPLLEKPTIPPGPPPPAPPEKFRGIIHELETLYVKSLTPRPLKEAVYAGFAFLNLGIALLQEHKDELAFCEKRLQFIRESEYPKLRRTLSINADRMPVMIIESEGIKSRHQVPPTNSRPYEEAVTEEILSQWYSTRLLSEVQNMAVHLMLKGLLRRESRVAHQFKMLFGSDEEEYGEKPEIEADPLDGVDDL